jgi:hypothetical protein
MKTYEDELDEILTSRSSRRKEAQFKQGKLEPRHLGCYRIDGEVGAGRRRVGVGLLIFLPRKSATNTEIVDLSLWPLFVPGGSFAIFAFLCG